MSERDTLLDSHEVRMMRAYLDKFGAGEAPENMPYFDILRICATLEHLMAQRDACRRVFEEWKEGDYCAYGPIVRAFAEALEMEGE